MAQCQSKPQAAEVRAMQHMCSKPQRIVAPNLEPAVLPKKREGLFLETTEILVWLHLQSRLVHKLSASEEDPD